MLPARGGGAGCWERARSHRPWGRVGRARGWGMWSRGRSSPKSPKMSSRVWVCGAELLVPAGGCCGRVGAHLGLTASPLLARWARGALGGGEVLGGSACSLPPIRFLPNVASLRVKSRGSVAVAPSKPPAHTRTPCPALCQRWHGHGVLFCLY